MVELYLSPGELQPLPSELVLSLTLIAFRVLPKQLCRTKMHIYQSSQEAGLESEVGIFLSRFLSRDPQVEMPVMCAGPCRTSIDVEIFHFV